MTSPLTNHTCSLILARQLKEAGVKQESLFYWAKNPISQEWQVIYYESKQQLEADFVANRYNLTSAFLASELGEMLPWDMVIARNIDKEWITTFQANGLKESEVASFRDKSLVEALGLMLLYLIKNHKL